MIGTLRNVRKKLGFVGGLNAEIGNPCLFFKVKGQDMAGAICFDSCALMGTISTNFSETDYVHCKI
jgi:hypothetical protein